MCVYISALVWLQEQPLSSRNINKHAVANRGINRCFHKTKELRSEKLMVLLAILLFLLITSPIYHYHSSVWVSSAFGANLFSPVFSMRTFVILKNHVVIALKYLRRTISQNKLCLWHSKQLSVYHFLFRCLQFSSEILSALFK